MLCKVWTKRSYYVSVGTKYHKRNDGLRTCNWFDVVTSVQSLNEVKQNKICKYHCSHNSTIVCTRVYLPVFMRYCHETGHKKSSLFI